ncbi:MAG TPA: formate dehydrogenase accessory sulfurtransferase FdhD [Limnochordia bacterium]|nr:formate dehydrogenase accessory sulfurtransferase FdhD [Limnochordia bacterium]
MSRNAAKFRIIRFSDGDARRVADVLAAEEPLELRVETPSSDGYAQVAVTMRTPGHDFELAAGFLFSEGLIVRTGPPGGPAGRPGEANDRPGEGPAPVSAAHAPDAIERISYCRDLGDGPQHYNIVNVRLRPGFALRPAERRFFMSSSCGVCGKGSIEAIRVHGAGPVTGDFVVEPEVLFALPERLRTAQALFDRTGGLHAAGLFDLDGTPIAVREDVGRHNAVDKLLGEALLNRRLPLDRHLLMVSGRASFEIVQKAAVAGIALIAAVSAPSSLACETAEAFGITLVGFLRERRGNIYTGERRIRLAAGDERRSNDELRSGDEGFHAGA